MRVSIFLEERWLNLLAGLILHLEVWLADDLWGNLRNDGWLVKVVPEPLALGSVGLGLSLE